MKFKGGIQIGKMSGHGSIWYSVEKYNPDEIIQFRFSQPKGFNGIHKFDGLNIQAGPQIGFKVSEKLDFSPSESGNEFDTDSIKDFDLQITGGLEYKSMESFFVQAMYTYGFSEVMENRDAHSVIFSAGIGFMF